MFQKGNMVIVLHLNSNVAIISRAEILFCNMLNHEKKCDQDWEM